MSEEYEKMFEKLPQPVQELSNQIAVKKFVAAMHAKQMEAAQQVAIDLRTELTEKLDEIEFLEVELRNAITENAKEAL